MTIPSTERRAGPFNGNGTATEFPFTFKVFADTDIVVAISDADGVERTGVLGSDYNVYRNANQDTSPGGYVKYAVASVEQALPTGYTLGIVGGRAYEQTTSLPQGANFNPTVLERMLDIVTILIQQLRDELNRTVRITTLSPVDTDATLPIPQMLSLLGWNADGTALQNYPIDTEVSTSLLEADLASSSNPTKGSKKIGQKRDDAGAVDTTVRDWINRQPISFGSDFGADDGGVVNVAAVLQAAIDAVEARGGGQLTIPWPAVAYNLGTTTILLPPNFELYIQGAPNIVSGGQPFKYSGTGLCLGTKYGENDQINNRGISVVNFGVELTGVGATGIRLRRIRDVFLRNCTVRITANNQTGFHFMGERAGGTYQGVFDVLGIRLASYANSASLTGVKHYVLSGTDGDGQCNSNSFFGLRGGGVGKFLEVGPSLSNSFNNLSMEAPGAADDYIHFLAGASKNTVYDLYAGDAPSGYTGKVMRCDNGSPGATENELYRYNAGANVDDWDLVLGAAANANKAVSAAGVTYTSTASGPAMRSAIQGEAYPRVEVVPGEIRFGDGTAAPIKAWPGTSVEPTIYSAALGTFTPNLLTGRSKFIRFDSGSSGTLTVALPTNASSEGDEVEFYFYNNTGSTINLSWNAGYLPASSFPSSIAANTRLAAIKARNVATNWIAS